jgi:hypothetical protein
VPTRTISRSQDDYIGIVRVGGRHNISIREGYFNPDNIVLEIAFSEGTALSNGAREPPPDSN